MRCVACNSEITHNRINNKTGEPEDLCSECLLEAGYTARNIDDEVTDDIELALDYLALDDIDLSKDHIL